MLLDREFYEADMKPRLAEHCIRYVRPPPPADLAAKGGIGLPTPPSVAHGWFV